MSATIYAGIDEAGLGPTLGPLVVGVSAFAVPGAFDLASPSGFDFYSALNAAVSLHREKGSKRIWVSDSKKLFTQSGGLARLEQALIPFLLTHHQSQQLPISPQSFRSSTTELFDDNWDTYPWYSINHLDSSSTIPKFAPVELLQEATSHLRAAALSVGIQTVHIRALVMPVRAFNRSLVRTRNKARTAFSLIEHSLRQLWVAHGPTGLVIKVDKQGGRSQYRQLLQETFDGATVETLREEHGESRYFVHDSKRTSLISFAMRSDENHLPVSLASISAKYIRETLMTAQNEWFSQHNPNLRPTAGYPQDALRWLRDSEKTRQKLKVPDSLLIRNR